MIECNENEKIVVDGVVYYKPIEVVKKKTGWEAPKEGEPMYSIGSRREDFIDSVGVFMQKCTGDAHSLERANAFADKDFAKQYARHEALWRKIAKWQAENDEPTNLKNIDKEKFYITFDFSSKSIDYVQYCWSYPTNSVSFSSAEKCMECIEIFRGELEWDMNEFKWRLDGE